MIFAFLAGFQPPCFSVHFWVSHQKKEMETQTLKVIELEAVFNLGVSFRSNFLLNLGGIQERRKVRDGTHLLNML